MTSSEPRRLTRTSRRTVLAALGSGVLSGLAGCNVGANPGVISQELGSAAGDGGTSDGWSQHTKLTPADDGVGHFGSSVALSGDGTTALVSATDHEGSDGSKPGPAYVLGRTDGRWRAVAELTPEVGDWDSSFGWGEGGAAVLSDDASTALVGAERADEPNGPEAGSAYVFERTDSTWGQQSRLVPDDGDRKDFFGKSVALSGDGRTALVGAPRAEDPNGETRGSVYVFERADGGWSQQLELAPDEGDSAALFGWSAVLEGDAAIIGAPGDRGPMGADGGSAYAFERADGGWSLQAKLASGDGDSGDFFGGSVTLAGDIAVIGAPEDDGSGGEDSGSVYAFERTDGTWTRRTRIVPVDVDGTDLFGAAVALTGDGARVLVGARVDEDPNGEQAGSAYVFERTDGTWRQRAKLAPEDGERGDVFGRSVALAGETALVGTAAGKAYVF